MTYYNNQQGDYQQSGGYQQQGSDYHQGGHQPNRPGLGGEANLYYSQSRPEQNQYSQDDQHGGGYGQPPQYQQQNHSSLPHYRNQGSSFHNSSQSYQNDGHDDQEDGERGVAGMLAGGAAGAFGGHKLGGSTGHSKTSTIVGAMVGAFAGHKLQDGVSDWKHKHDEEKKEGEDRKHEHHNQPEEHSGFHNDEKPRSGHYAGGFTGSARDLHLDAHGDYNLRASLQRRDGSWQESCISLNRIIANDQGSFRWFNGGGGGGQATYTVQQGDTLRNIAARFDINFEEIARHNGIANPDQIWPGQTLQVPSRGCSSGGNFGASCRDARLTDGGQRLEADLMRNGQWVQSSIVLDERIGNNDGTLHFVE